MQFLQNVSASAASAGVPPPLPSPLAGRVRRCHAFCEMPCLILRSAPCVGTHPPVRPPGEHEKVTAWRHRAAQEPPGPRGFVFPVSGQSGAPEAFTLSPDPRKPRHGLVPPSSLARTPVGIARTHETHIANAACARRTGPLFSRDFPKKSAQPTSKKSLKRPRSCYTFACVGVPSVTSAA